MAAGPMRSSTSARPLGKAPAGRPAAPAPKPAVTVRPSTPSRFAAGNGKPAPAPAPSKPTMASSKSAPPPRMPTGGPRNGQAKSSLAAKPEPKILFQKYFKSVGSRTYAAQIKEAGNGNHFIVLTEGRRDETTGEVRKTKLVVFSEDFVAFFRMLQETAQFIKANPVPDAVRRKREKFWARKAADERGGANSAAAPRNGAPKN